LKSSRLLGNFPFQGPLPLSAFVALSGLYQVHAILRAVPCGSTKTYLSASPARSFYKVSCHFRVFPTFGLLANKPRGFSAFWRSWLFSSLQRILLQKCPFLPGQSLRTPGTSRSFYLQCVTLLRFTFKVFHPISRRPPLPVPAALVFCLCPLAQTKPRLQRVIPQNQCVRLPSSARLEA
jgi:hypothetical protein